MTGVAGVGGSNGEEHPVEPLEVLRTIGPVWNQDIARHRDMVVQTYTPLVQKGPKQGISVTQDVPYGAHERQKLDIFQPAIADRAPVLLFVHGGAFTRGRKSVNGEIYDNVLYWFARRGFVGVNIEYRLAPEAPYPAGAQDVAAAVEWVAGNIGRFGGDGRRIVLMGHSAGGTHVGTYLLDPNTGIEPHASVTAAIFVSARLRADMLPDNPNAKHVQSYFGADPAILDRKSPVAYAERCKHPVFIAIAEYENRFLDLYGLEFAHRIAVLRGQAPRMVQLPHHTHTSIVAHFNTGEDFLGNEIISFLDRECGIGRLKEHEPA